MIRRSCLGVVFAIAACKGGSPGDLPTRIPHVASADLVAAPAGPDVPPPALLVIDASGKMALTEGPATWPEYATYAVPKTMHPVAAVNVEEFVAEVRAMGARPRDRVAHLDDPAGDLRDLGSDEPPAPDDDAEESGGTGTAMALDEGKMGKPDSARAEGQYKMRKANTVPTSQRGRVGVFASLDRDQDSARGGFGYGPGADPDRPVRYADVIGEALATTIATPIAIAADPRAKATILVDAIRASEGSLLVAVGADVRVLRVQFARDTKTYGAEELAEGRTFIEVRATSAGIEIEDVAAPAIKASWTLDSVMQGLAAARRDPRFANAPIDVLVGDDLDAQHLVDLLALLDRARVPILGLGKFPKSDGRQWKLRGKTQVVFRPTQLYVNADMGPVRANVKFVLPQLRTCYETALRANPSLEGEIVVAFTLAADGSVESASGSRADAVLSDCIVGKFKTIVFPKRAGPDPVKGTITFQMQPHY